MSIHFDNRCRGYRCVGDVFIYRKPDGWNMMGNGETPPEDGDICMVTEHSGDCFHTYALLRCTGNPDMYYMVREFKAYEFGDKVCSIPKKQFHAVQGGYAIKIEWALLQPIVREKSNERSS